MAKSTGKVAICMGSSSDWNKLQKAASVLDDFSIAYETKVLSAHRTPEAMLQAGLNFQKDGFAVVIAAAGGAAHLPGMLASVTTLPVIGVPVLSSNSVQGIDSLLSIVQMPAGVPVGTMAIDGAENAALYAVRILGVSDEQIAKKLTSYRESLKEKVRKQQEKLDD